MKRVYFVFAFVLFLAVAGCQKDQPKAPAGAGAGMQAMPVKTVAVSLQPVAQSSEYMATVKSRRSATILPQVAGMLTSIRVHSGEHVKAGQVMMTIDPRQQQATVASQAATEQQKKAAYDFDNVQLERQKKLFAAGVTSKEALDQAQQAYDNAKADYEASRGTRDMQEQLLGYYTIKAPFDGVVGDIPVHVGDYVAPTMGANSTGLTTVDQGGDLEAYIYIPTERAGEVHQGLAVELYDTAGKLLEKSKIDFVSPQVDPSLQGILAKAPVHRTAEMTRNAQLIKAKVIWSTKPMPVIPVLAVTRRGVQSFVYVAKAAGNGKFVADQLPVTLGDSIENSYSITSGLKPGDQVIVSSTQFLVNGMPVMPIPG
ncbi:efflux RND transporter periplasmic adaptor subunit [Occallatibacter savannae]|uniref:efflux RND transporter periplasmic adaptor subunit n=1 Tax=Occallatibacter savannae TaxID=1002691 RepID=UPI001EF4A116|nr:efflux RND transporter periplasmic adaptor subunit [Occallatibacter savannae]